ncbi:hypothetical protein GCM10007167_07300 [Vulcaniibacterium thermophilum]|uniref:Uncharacterized protein n=1 Tax=Vulcaniibacterium thermophilum TaxID=1169913 RepID=A0A918YXR0_9GAMM|nr:hypothetical protein GCM10007167_07300 [Vulcaniibacterium thermophilum]
MTAILSAPYSPERAPVKFRDVLVSREDRFSLGIEETSGRYYLSIPVSNGLVDYEEYYEIDPLAFERYRTEPKAALPFVERCRRRECDDLLIQKPGKNRGTPL